MYKFLMNGMEYEFKEEGDVHVLYENSQKFATVSYTDNRKEHYHYEYCFHMNGYDGIVHVNNFESIKHMAEWLAGSMS